MEIRAARKNNWLAGRIVRVHNQIQAKRTYKVLVSSWHCIRVARLPRTRDDMGLVCWWVFEHKRRRSRSCAGGTESIQIEQCLSFSFKASNNQAKYESFIAGLLLAKDMGARKVECKNDSRVTVGHVNGKYEVKDHLLLKYYHRIVRQWKNSKVLAFRT